MGYSLPKCTCNGNQTHSSKTCKFLLKCLHDMDENVTHPLPCLELSLTPSHMPKPRVRKYYFQNKRFFFLKNILSSFGKIYWTTLRGELLGDFPKQSWVHLRDELLDNSPRQFFGKSSLKFLSQPFFLFLSFMSCTHTYCARLPRCIWNALCHFQTTNANISQSCIY